VSAIAILAEFGLAWIRTRSRGRRWVPAFTIAAIVLAHAEAIRAPIPYVPAIPIPAAYDRLAKEKRAIVAEFPFPSPRGFFYNNEYMLASTRYWRPLLNGYSGFVPASYTRAWQSLTGFPDNRSLRALRALGVTHVVVHYESSTPMMIVFPRMDSVPRALQPIAETGALSIYRLRWDRIPDQP